MSECGDRVGSWAGYIRHYRAAQREGRPVDACAACRAANSARVRDLYHRDPSYAAAAKERVRLWRARRARTGEGSDGGAAL